VTSSKKLADFFDAAVSKYGNGKEVSNWVMGELLRLLNANDMEIEELLVTPEGLVRLLELQREETINGKIAKQVFEEMFKTGKTADVIITEKNLVQISDTGELDAIIAGVMQNNPKSVDDFRSGKQQAIGFLVGQVMKETKGKANPKVVNDLLLKKLEE
jgi:aspartyl-tRNA(Asn)/glutamyl-tRNA(Gln) amidotransferase subunit B